MGLPESSEWIYEVKLDGYRCLAGDEVLHRSLVVMRGLVKVLEQYEDLVVEAQCVTGAAISGSATSRRGRPTQLNLTRRGLASKVPEWLARRWGRAPQPIRWHVHSAGMAGSAEKSRLWYGFSIHHYWYPIALCCYLLC